MEAAKGKTESVELGKWMERLAKARTIATRAETHGCAEQETEGHWAVDLDVDVGDEVWVLFPNVRPGSSRKFAFRMHGSYMLKEWLHGEKRVALLAHKDDENDVIMAHVDRIVKKKEVPKTLRDKWKPIRMELAKPAGGDQRKAKEKEISSEPSREGRLKVAPAGEEEVFDTDGAFEIEKILDHNTDAKGFVQFKVRFVGFGPKDDLWYEEADLVAMEPEMVEAYKKRVKEKSDLLGRNKAGEKGEGKPKGKTASTVKTSQPGNMGGQNRGGKGGKAESGKEKK